MTIKQSLASTASGGAMSIPESQFETWARQGSTASATSLYERIKRALEADPNVSKHKPEIFLQGSYRNSTNIHGESDVDVVAMLRETYKPDYSQLTAYERQREESQSIAATYHLSDFRRDVCNAIRHAFPALQITEGGKSIKIPRTANNIPADVVPCLEYQLFQPARGLLLSPPPLEGIWIWDTQRGIAAVSFPKQHYQNGVSRHSASNEWYKPLIRIFKNARCWLEDNRRLARDTASSYQIECLLYNVPTEHFGLSYDVAFLRAINWLATADMHQFKCQNGIQMLFDEGRWSIEQARTYVNALMKMYLEWN